MALLWAILLIRVQYTPRSSALGRIIGSLELLNTFPPNITATKQLTYSHCTLYVISDALWTHHSVKQRRKFKLSRIVQGKEDGQRYSYAFHFPILLWIASWYSSLCKLLWKVCLKILNKFIHLPSLPLSCSCMRRVIILTHTPSHCTNSLIISWITYLDYYPLDYPLPLKCVLLICIHHLSTTEPKGMNVLGNWNLSLEDEGVQRLKNWHLHC